MVHLRRQLEQLPAAQRTAGHSGIMSEVRVIGYQLMNFEMVDDNL